MPIVVRLAALTCPGTAAIKGADANAPKKALLFMVRAPGWTCRRIYPTAASGCSSICRARDARSIIGAPHAVHTARSHAPQPRTSDVHRTRAHARSLTAHAQTAQINGTVIDASSAVVPGSTASPTTRASSISRTARTSCRSRRSTSWRSSLSRRTTSRPSTGRREVP
jgi:hypothetical protein